MSDLLRKKYLLQLLLAPLLFFSAAAMITGCGGDEEEAEPPIVDEVAAPAEQPVEVPAKPSGPPMAETVPSTLPGLAFMPAEAQIAVALPALPGLRDRIVPLVKALSEPERDIDTELKLLTHDAAAEVGVEADTYEALAAALGVDPAAPVAAFVDLTKTIESAAEAKAKYDADQAAKEGAAPATPEADAVPEGSEPTAEESADEPQLQPDHFENAEEPDWVVVLGVTDPAKARTEIERIVAADGELASLPSGTEEVDGISITTREIWGYFTTDKHIAFGSLDLLRGAAKRVKDPATFRYGTVECPPNVADEAVALLYGGRFLPMFEKALPLMGLDSGAEPLVAAQMLKYKSMFAEGGDDPMVLTGSIADGKIELLSRMDTATHPGIMEKTGQPAPLRLARYLPENTLALISLRFTEEYKKQLLEEVVPVIGASSDANAAASAGMATQVISQIGDELSIGVTGAQAGLPVLYAMVGLAQPEATQGLLQMFVPMEAGVQHEGYTIGKLPTPIGMDINLSFVDNILLATTSEEGAKAVIDLHKAQKASPLFAAMEPPMDIEKPVYQTIVLNSGIIEQGMAAAAMVPGSTATMDPGLSRVTNAIREIRAVGALEDTWLTARWTVYLKDLEAAIAASKAAAEAAPSADGTPAEGEAGAPTEAPAEAEAPAEQ
jgi:hypothetical protein